MLQETLPPQEILPPREIMPPSDRILRIVDAVGQKNIPDGLNYDALKTAINASLAHYCELARTDEFLERCEALIAVRKNAIKKARELLSSVRKVDDSDWGKPSWLDSEDQSISQIEEHIIKKYEDEIKELEEERDFGGWGRGPHGYDIERWVLLCGECNQWTPIKWLVGRYLLRDFMAHFPCEPGTNEESPYIKFVLRVLKECDIKNGDDFYAWGTIAKAVRDLRNNRGKRKRAKA